MIIIVFVYLARVLVRHAAAVVTVVAGAVVTGALLPLVAARVFTNPPTTIAGITTISRVAIALRHRHDAECRGVRVSCVRVTCASQAFQ